MCFSRFAFVCGGGGGWCVCVCGGAGGGTCHTIFWAGTVTSLSLPWLPGNLTTITTLKEVTAPAWRINNLEHNTWRPRVVYVSVFVWIKQMRCQQNVTLIGIIRGDALCIWSVLTFGQFQASGFRLYSNTYSRIWGTASICTRAHFHLLLASSVVFTHQERCAVVSLPSLLTLHHRAHRVFLLMIMSSLPNEITIGNKNMILVSFRFIK